MKRGTLIAVTSAAAVVVLVIAVMVTLVAILPKPAPQPLAEVTYSTYKPVPSWDKSEHTESSPERLRELTAALEDSGWRPGEYIPDPGCDGGTSIDMQLTYADGSRATLRAVACGSTPPTVADEVAAVLENW